MQIDEKAILGIGPVGNAQKREEKTFHKTGFKLFKLYMRENPTTNQFFTI